MSIVARPIWASILVALLCGLAVRPVAAQGPTCAVTPGTVLSLARTPHLWVADEQSVVHWAGDTRALAGQTVNWSRQCTVAEATLRGLTQGDPWLSAGLLKLGDPIYLVKWEESEPVPRLLHISSIADVELFGINERNYGSLVYERAAWEALFSFNADLLARGTLDRAASAPVAAAPPSPLPSAALPAASPSTPSTPSASVPVANACAPRLGEEAYGATMIANLQALTASGDRMQRLTDRPEVASTAWRAGLRAELRTWQGAAVAVRSVCPPELFQRFHDELSEAMRLYESAATDLVTALDLMDQALSTRSTANLARIESLLSSADDKFARADARMQAARANLLAEFVPGSTPPAPSSPPPALRPGFNPQAYLGQGDRYNCSDFQSQAEAQAVLRADRTDPNQLDLDRNGIACESNPAPRDLVPVPRP
jgi:hypothetical protein